MRFVWVDVLCRRMWKFDRCCIQSSETIMNLAMKKWKDLFSRERLSKSGLLAVLSGVTLFTGSCGKVQDWRQKRATETWNRRIAEYMAAHNVWKVTVPGLDGYVYPAGIEAQAVDLMLTDVLMAEHILRTQLPLLDTVQTFPSPPVHLKLDNYLRQYKGFRDNDGKLHVLVNGVWKWGRRIRPEGDVDAGREKFGGDRGWIGVKDGGNAFWQVWVDVDSRRLYGLSVNGEA